MGVLAKGKLSGPPGCVSYVLIKLKQGFHKIRAHNKENVLCGD